MCVLSTSATKRIEGAKDISPPKRNVHTTCHRTGIASHSDPGDDSGLSLAAGQ